MEAMIAGHFDHRSTEHRLIGHTASCLNCREHMVFLHQCATSELIVHIVFDQSRSGVAILEYTDCIL